jgi:hypothetical protein
MTEPEVPYRQPAERRKLGDAERRWYTKQGGAERGPYDAEAIARSVKTGMIKRTALVRAEDDNGWRPLQSVEALVAAMRGANPGAGWTLDRREVEIPVPAGTFAGGFAAGFFGGVIGLVLVRAMALGTDTKRGATTGFGVQVLLGIVWCLLVSVR